jgi:hypothetical protein
LFELVLETADFGQGSQGVVKDVGDVVEQQGDEANEEIQVSVGFVLELVTVLLVGPDGLDNLGDVESDGEFIVVMLLNFCLLLGKVYNG